MDAMAMRVCGGMYRSIRLDCPSAGVRPTTDRVKEAIFSVLMNDLQDARVLDLFAGCGSLGIEALSRGAAHATFVDSSRSCIETIRRNIHSIKAEKQATIVKSEAELYVKKCTRLFDLVFMDPPYHKGLATELTPHVYNLLKVGGILVVEHSQRDVIPMEAWKAKRYGDTSISYFRRSGE
jgi:16S rRNA (guanine(966)-N(2))-methyltransferase RsmD